MELARGSNAIKYYNPKRGTEEAWKKTHLELIRAAFDGIGYCANEDIEAIWDVIADIGALNSQGHMVAHK